MKRILIIEDDSDLQEGLLFTLRGEGYEVDTVGSMRSGIKKIEGKAYDCILLDCNLPDGNGFDLCREIKGKSEASILMLTARNTELDEVKALELGADDFMTKPFSVAVLKARIRKLLSKKGDTQLLVSGNIRLDKRECRVYREGEEIFLSKVEYKLILYFIDNKNQVLSKEQILEHIWDKGGKFVEDNIISVNIRRLRKKIENDPAAPERIKTVHGLGYIWKDGA